MNDYFKIFNITKEYLSKLIAIAMSKGGDYADLFFEYSISNELSLLDHQVNAIGKDADYGVGIRVLKGEQTGYAYSESTAVKDMERAALAAAQIADTPSTSFLAPAFKEIKFVNRYPIISPWEDYALSDKIEFLNNLDTELFALDRRMVKVTERLTDSDTKVLFFNSSGDFFCDERPLASVGVSCIVSENDRIETISFSRSFRAGSEMLTDCLKKEVIDHIAERIPIAFEACQPKGGKMAVVMGAGGSGILLHEAIGHAFEADYNRKGTSIFCNKMGKKICSEKINVVDDATLQGNRGALNIDDEGIPGQKTYMVKDGILNSYLHDRISAKYYGVAPTGNGRRESFRFNPIPRMRATYMENGKCTAEDIIKSVKKGVYVDNFLNGQVEIGAGDFTFYVKSGYLIEKGHLTSPIKDINIIGNGPQALADILEVASDNRIDNSTWLCGKEQYCCVSCGMPTVLIKSLVVGGGN